MKWFLILFPSLLFGEIYDCFLFNNELDLLEIRLEEMNEHVDYFVLVEAVETFRGNPKPLHFNDNKERFAKFADKIIHLVNSHRLPTSNPWAREKFQRNYIQKALWNCKRNDMIILSDVDEIVRKEKILPLIEKARLSPIACKQKVYRFRFNRYNPIEWYGSIAMPFHILKEKTPEGIRRMRNKIEYLDNGGWHFTSIGSVDNQILKFQSYSHVGYDIPKNNTREKIIEKMHTYPIVEIDETFPKYLRENTEKFKGLID